MICMLRKIVATLLCCLVAAAVAVAAAAESQKASRVMVLPFDGADAGQFGYLTDSIRTMLATRLAAKQGVTVVDYALSPSEVAALRADSGTASTADATFSRLNVDYIASGALYALQTGLKIQVSLSRKSGSGPEGVFTSLAENEDRILGAVEELADDIAARGPGAHPAGPLIAGTQGGGEQQDVAGFNTEHPEKAFKKGLYGGSIVAEGSGAMAVESLGVRRSSSLPLTLISMTTGDLDGDGQTEIVAASRGSLEVYRFEATLFTRLAVYDAFDGAYKIHAVNVADLDGDGQKEIYVSGNNDIPAASAIFTWSPSTGLVAKMTGIPYYIRPVEVPGEGWLLAGQRGVADFGRGLVGQKVVKLGYSQDHSQLVEEKPLALPPKVNLFDFVYADLDGQQGKELVVVNRNEKLMVYNAANELQWVSEEDYGGSRNYIGPPKSSAPRGNELMGGSTNARMDRSLVFVPLRILAADLDGDGKDEILIGGNKRVTPKVFINFREYDGGAVTCLSWLDGAMTALWRTNTVTGYLADYAFTGKEEGETNDNLYLAQVPDMQLFGFSFSSDSKLLKYSLNVTEK
ncbi:MAG: FG-GAP-like repeat-containing protein [Desulfopila sp.]